MEYTFDKEIALDSLQKITVKGLDKLTDGQLLKNYPDVYWKGVMGMRDKISHHYFEIDTDVVFRTLAEDIPAMISVVEKIITDLGLSTSK